MPLLSLYLFHLSSSNFYLDDKRRGQIKFSVVKHLFIGGDDFFQVIFFFFSTVIFRNKEKNDKLRLDIQMDKAKVWAFPLTRILYENGRYGIIIPETVIHQKFRWMTVNFQIQRSPQGFNNDGIQKL